jgi:hypothetical protein
MSIYMCNIEEVKFSAGFLVSISIVTEACLCTLLLSWHTIDDYLCV